MINPYVLWLSILVFAPAAGALVLAFLPRDRPNLLRGWSLAVTVFVALWTIIFFLVPEPTGADTTRFDLGVAEMQSVFSLPWIPAFNINYLMGFDGISFPLVVLTSFLSVFAMGASWNIDRHVKAYCILFLLLETGMLGVFLALDFFLFYVFWEVMLLPMYFLIGVWGGPRREYAAIKFFLYTLIGSVLMLVAILMLYFTSDLRLLSQDQLVASGEIDRRLDASEQTERFRAIADSTTPVHTFNMLALAEIGQLRPSAERPWDALPFNRDLLFGKSVQWWAFLLLFIGFAVKVPAVPVHTWLPDAHVEAPTPISMILAGVLLKMGGYGILRICYPICPDGGYELAWLVCGIGVVSMVYGALAALAQKDFKRLVAYSSVSHMGYVLLGLGVWSATAGYQYDWQYWSQGISGAMFQMIAHGISSAGMFFMVGVIYDRVHHRNLDQFGGLFARMPTYSGLAFILFFAGLGLPGLCGFWGEVFVTLSAWNYSRALAVISAAVVVLTAGYILWTLQRVYLGPEYRGPHPEALTPITARELAIAVPLAVAAIALGVYPRMVFDFMTPTINRQAQQLAEWTEEAKEPELAATAIAAERAADAAELAAH